jgi:hypothetical protein
MPTDERLNVHGGMRIMLAYHEADPGRVCVSRQASLLSLPLRSIC